MYNLNNPLVKYVRNEENHPVGCIIAFDKDELSWSLCNPQDQFSKNRAVEIAMSRFIHFKEQSNWRDKLDMSFWAHYFYYERPYYGYNVNPYRQQLIKEMTEMRERSRKYFKEE